MTDWYVDLKINGQQIIKELFYVGYGYTDVPIPLQWRLSLVEYLPQLINYGYSYILEGNTLTINGLSCLDAITTNSISLDVGINININCQQ
jgi:hypothetical protein